MQHPHHRLNNAAHRDAQRNALEAVLRRVAEITSLGRTGVVQIDLDLTALTPRERTRRALAEAGTHFQLEKFAYPQNALPMIPGYTAEAWLAFLRTTNLPNKYPQLPWQVNRKEKTIYSVFHDSYWTNAWLIEDEPTPGLGEFVRRVEDCGGVVVFLSGRWQTEQIAPSLAALRQAGIAAPMLSIGNHRHEDNILPGEEAWSDNRVKARTQEEIRERYGVPVAIFDDRFANRQAVIEANRDYLSSRGLPDAIGIAVTLPGFSYDPISESAAMRIATFESFRSQGADPTREPLLFARYPRLCGTQDYRGLVTGLGRNGRGYVLPWLVETAAESLSLPSEYHPHFEHLAQFGQGSLSDDRFMEEVTKSIPDDVRKRLCDALNQAEVEAQAGLAAPFPENSHDRQSLWYSLACSWLHSRDLEVVMAALGYPVDATGIHDMHEHVPADDVIQAITRSLERGNRYSEWFLRWVQRLDRRGTVNIDFLNPNLTVGTWLWKAGVDMPQDAMDAHRLSAHHEGNGAGRYDPIEATVNNLLHAREGVYGVQKRTVTTWESIEQMVQTQVGAAALAKSSWGGHFLREAVPIIQLLESRGYIMPWGCVAVTASHRTAPDGTNLSDGIRSDRSDHD